MSPALLAALVCLFAGLFVTAAWQRLAQAHRLDDGSPLGHERVREAKDRLVWAWISLAVAVFGQAAFWWFMLRE